MMQQKIDNLSALSKYRSELMGIAIIWIVLFHSNISAPDNFFLRVLWYLFVSFGGGIGVDIFFILSGFGLFYSVKFIDKEVISRNWGGWIVKRMKRILPSYLIVAILYYILKGDFCLYNLCQLNFLVNGIRDFWFIPAIVICYLLFPLFYQIGKKIGFRNMMIVSTLIVVAVTYALNYFNPIYYSKIEIFLQRIPCFVLGIYWGYLSVINSYKEYYLGIIFSVLLIPVCMYTHFVGSSRWTFFFMTIVFIQVLLLLLIYLGNTLKTILQYLGKRSLQIYLTHVSLGIMLSNLILIKEFSLAIYFVSALVMGELLYRTNNFLLRKY